MRGDQKTPRPWPYRPDHIIYDGDAYGLNGTGIIAHNHLQGILAKICINIGYSATIIEYALDGTPIQIDSPTNIFAKYKTYKNIKNNIISIYLNKTIPNKNQKSYLDGGCIQCAQIHARLLRDIVNKESQKNIFDNPNIIIPELKILYPNLEDFKNNNEIIDERLVAQYDCPLIGYRELLFPIIFEGKMISAFFIDQIILEKQEEFIIEMMKTLPSRISDCVNSNTKINKNEIAETIEEIIRNHERWLNENPEKNLLTEDKYRHLMYDTISELKEFELLLYKEIKHQRINYIQQNISTEITLYSRSLDYLPGKDIADEDFLYQFWDKICESLERIVEIFSLRFMIVFGSKKIFQTKKEILEVVAKTKKCEEILSINQLNKLSIIIDDLPNDYTMYSREGAKHLFDKDVYINLDDCQLIIMPVIQKKSSSIALLIGYNSENPSYEDENIPGSDFNTALKSFNLFVLLSFVSLLASAEEEKANRQLQYLGHEAGQLVSGLDWLRMTYLANANDVKKLSYNKTQDLCEDIKGFIGQLSIIFNMASSIGKNELPSLNRTKFLPFGDVLLKWKDTYRLESQKKCLQIHVAELNPYDPTKPSLFGDKYLFEQLVYNLISNAVKYSYRGTKINIGCKVDNCKDSHSPYILTVTDYGTSFPIGNEAYKAFTRGKPDDGMKGLGLGLYIASLIVSAHNGTITHECIQISPYNVPLIEPYINFSFKEKDKYLPWNLTEELSRLSNNGEYEQIIAKSEDNIRKYFPSNEAIRNEISLPTYKVTMVTSIPR